MLKVSSLIREDREFSASIDTLRSAYSAPVPLPLVVGGLAGGATSAYLTEAVLEAVRLIRGAGASSPVLLLVSSDEMRESVLDTLATTGLSVRAYKLREPVFYNISASHDIDRERLSVLSAILSGRVDVVVSTLPAVLSFTMPKDRLVASSLDIEVGLIMSPNELCEKLALMGFRSLDAVEEKGQFAKRGGIVDFWGADTDMPIRVEFFGDEVDRMVYFDPISQRANGRCDAFHILPCEEMVLDENARGRILKVVRELLSKSDISDEIATKLRCEESELMSGVGMNFRDKYMSLIYEEHTTLLDYIKMGGRGVTFVLDTNAVRESGEGWHKRLAETTNSLISYGALSRSFATYAASISDYEKFRDASATIHINTLAGGVGNIKLSGLFGFRCRRTVAYGDDARMLFEDLIALRRGGYKVILMAENRQGAESLSASLLEMDIATIPMYDAETLDLSKIPEGRIVVAVGAGEGFELISPRIALLSMSRDKGRAVMANKRRQRVMRRIGNAAQRLMSHADLTAGDYVVHAAYGIGRFDGIEAVTVDGVTKDYITIQYAGTDKLFVPCDRLENISKYIGERDSDGTVKLSKMGGTEWARTKSRAKEAAKDIAKGLVKLYAERQRLPGFAFPPQSEMEDEFDAQFDYDETDSQLTAIAEIKADMQRSVPMNRLLCGDVGFGKTEVALRAAFKAILAGKQVAFLVPTTILALQHYSTALTRMRGYAVNIEMLSRFKKPKERAEILRRAERGDVDLLIGTHSLLSKNMRFRDLGLLIVDEEQRFGVLQKERLREMTKNVDTLMLSATPIPRTLNMAMNGISDISILDEAPGERRPVQTYVLEHDDGLIADAIRREIDRGGQVLYLYNKIEDIHVIAAKVMNAIPEARVAYAHGRMDKEELEDIWQELVRGEIDVLVCTTIVETGVDLPNANTLIIENADRFGLSQLHQIRGRVGRSKRQAYAYFTFRPGKALSEIAEKRLSALREFAEFGAGFKIALRDLEIRGAGNLLGREQHGYIESVGYDLYLKLLSEAVLEEKGEVAKELTEAQIVIDRSAHIPESYISSSAGRMEMYKKISLIRNVEDKDEVVDELIDRFGDMPRVTERLINVSLARALASVAKITRVEERDGRITLYPTEVRLDIWAEVFASVKGLNFLGKGSPNVVYRLKPGDDSAKVAVDILTRYVAEMNA